MFVNCPNVVEVCESAFYGCAALRSFKAKLKIVGNAAFFGCHSLCEIDLNSVEIVSVNSFACCGSLISV
jgi:hypothetical protein